MVLTNFLPKEDKEKILAYVKNNISSSMSCGVDYLLREWAANKEYLYHVFGDNFILEKDVVIPIDEYEMDKEITNLFIHHNDFINNWNRFQEKFFQTLDDAWWHLNELCNTDSLKRNCYEGVSFEIPDPKREGKFIRIQHGSKAIKMIGKIAEAYDIEGFEEFRLKHSMILNQKNVKGKLCISIHPLDYMTMSDNNSNWNSCMSWRHEGCYRQGTVEMMNSPIVVVAYLKSDNNPLVISWDMEKDSQLTWNNKKWRELFICDKNIITGIKGYPYTNYELTETINNWLKELITNYDKSLDYNDSYRQIFPFTEADYLDDEPSQVIIEPTVNYMYNDFDCGVNHYGYLSNDYVRRDGETIYINYSGASECMSCGALDIYCETEGDLECEKCAPRYYCDNCGELVDEDHVIEVDGRYYCSYCYENYIIEDVYGEEHINFDCFPLHVCDDSYKYFDRDCYFYIYKEKWDEVLEDLKDCLDISKIKCVGATYNGSNRRRIIPISAVKDNYFETRYGKTELFSEAFLNYIKEYNKFNSPIAVEAEEMRLFF